MLQQDGLRDERVSGLIDHLESATHELVDVDLLMEPEGGAWRPLGADCDDLLQCMLEARRWDPLRAAIVVHLGGVYYLWDGTRRLAAVRRIVETFTAAGDAAGADAAARWRRVPVLRLKSDLPVKQVLALVIMHNTIGRAGVAFTLACALSAVARLFTALAEPKGVTLEAVAAFMHDAGFAGEGSRVLSPTQASRYVRAVKVLGGSLAVVLSSLRTSATPPRFSLDALVAPCEFIRDGCKLSGFSADVASSAVSAHVSAQATCAKVMTKAAAQRAAEQQLLALQEKALKTLIVAELPDDYDWTSADTKRLLDHFTALEADARCVVVNSKPAAKLAAAYAVKHGVAHSVAHAAALRAAVAAVSQLLFGTGEAGESCAAAAMPAAADLRGDGRPRRINAGQLGVQRAQGASAEEEAETAAPPKRRRHAAPGPPACDDGPEDVMSSPPPAPAAVSVQDDADGSTQEAGRLLAVLEQRAAVAGLTRLENICSRLQTKSVDDTILVPTNTLLRVEELERPPSLAMLCPGGSGGAELHATSHGLRRGDRVALSLMEVAAVRAAHGWQPLCVERLAHPAQLGVFGFVANDAKPGARVTLLMPRVCCDALVASVPLDDGSIVASTPPAGCTVEEAAVLLFTASLAHVATGWERRLLTFGRAALRGTTLQLPDAVAATRVFGAEFEAPDAVSAEHANMECFEAAAPEDEATCIGASLVIHLRLTRDVPAGQPLVPTAACVRFMKQALKRQQDETRAALRNVDDFMDKRADATHDGH